MNDHDCVEVVVANLSMTLSGPPYKNDSYETAGSEFLL